LLEDIEVVPSRHWGSVLSSSAQGSNPHRCLRRGPLPPPRSTISPK
jgi:hypothetical protein